MAGATSIEYLEQAGVTSVAELAGSGAVPQCLQWLGGQRRWIDQKHLELCRIPAPTFQEERRAEWMAAELTGFGWNAQLDRAGNVIATLEQLSGGPFIALTAHLDTVLAPRSPEEVNIGADGRFQGPGTADNGAGLAALLAVAAALTHHPIFDGFSTQLLLIANVGEEGEGNLSGMRYLCRQFGFSERIAAFLVLDGPSTDRITARAVASRRFEVSISGPGGHSWSDFGTVNPVHALSRAIALFADRFGNGTRRSSDRIDDRSAFNFGTIDGGTSVNSIPTLARAKVDLRAEDPARIEDMAGVLTGAVERALEIEHSRSLQTRLSAKIREIGSRPGGALPENAPILAYLRAVDAYLGIHSYLDSASTDANIPLSLGRQAVSIGAGGQGGGAHTPTEWYDPEGREIGLKRILLTLCLLMRAASSCPPVNTL